MLTNKGFTLVEVLAATLIITLGAGGAFALTQRTLSFTTNAAFQLEASYLAQEGMEIVRNIRDTNLLKIHKGVGATWMNGLTGCEAGCEADYTENSLGLSQDRFLKLNSGLYTYTQGSDTIFKRTLTLTQPSADVLQVSVQVTWEEKNRSHAVAAATELYNWLPTNP